MKRNIFNKQDQSFMNLALNLSRKNIGITKNNPSVGCVLVKNDTIIATGVTGKNGVPHGENIAILKAGEDAKNSTLYVTLEPCSHFGKTSPCADLIIEAKIAKVVIAAIDPDERVNGQGIKKLENAGIEVVFGLMENEAKKINRGFFTSKNLSRPFTTLKLATSANEKIWSENSQWISSKKFQQYSHYYRFRNDAILIGANTLKKDNPMLDCRLSGLEKYSPKRIILSSKLDFDVNNKIIKTAKSISTYIATNNSNVEKFINSGVEIINFDNLADLLQKFTKLGINNLLIEGGGVVAKNFLESGLVDRFLWLKSPNKIEEKGIDAIFGENNIEKFIKECGFKVSSSKTIEGDVLTEFLSKT
ncbi:MAG: diaminohydroxyphosphoribosylaminopyrimidine deaminase [Lentimonas sp.]|jgi:diaminohydroxyphosphoribosylaminopyrimidine deaminase/5-amino-6-(5-phosphoribosylamino)uracil reductase